MIRHFLLGLSLMAFSAAAMAQSTTSDQKENSCQMTTFGISAQANRTNIYGPQPPFRFKSGFSASLDLGWKLNKHTDFKSGLLYTKSGKLLIQDGSLTNDPADKFEIKTSFNYTTLTIPLCVEFHPIEFKKFSPYGGIGGLLGAQIGASYEQTGFIGGTTVNEESNNIYKDSPIKSTGIAVGALGYVGMAYQPCTNYQIRLHTQASTIISHDRWDDRVTANRFWNLGIGVSVVRLMN